MSKLYAVPYSDYRHVKHIVDYIRNKYKNITEFNHQQLSLKDSEGNIYYLFNDPLKVHGFQFSGMEICPDFEYNHELLRTMSSRVRN